MAWKEVLSETLILRSLWLDLSNTRILRLVIWYYKELKLTATSLMLNDSLVNKNLFSWSAHLLSYSSFPAMDGITAL